MIPIDHQHWQKVHRLAVAIHRADSRSELVAIVSKDLPLTLNAAKACWRDHDTPVSMDRCSAPDACLDEVLALILSRKSKPKPAPQPARRASPASIVFDIGGQVSAIHCSCKLATGCSLRTSPETHRIATHFLIEGAHGVLITVCNSRPFTRAQKYVLALVREHLAIAASRHCRDAPDRTLPNPLHAETILSRRESEVLPYLVKGFTNPEIANALCISPRTAEKHVASILDKAGVDNRRMLIGRNPFPSRPVSHRKNG